MTDDNSKTSKTTAIIVLAVVALASLGLGLWLSQHLHNSAHETTEAGPAMRQGVPQNVDNTVATVLPHGKPLAPFQLTDSNGKAFDLARLRGKWSFLFFGYTNCPDVCPLTLSILNGVYRKLEKTPAEVKNTQVVFISVDPDRDSIRRLKRYVHFFNPHFLGATGKAKQIANIAGQVGAHYGFRNNPKSKAGYTVTHSAEIILVDPQVRERAVFPPPHKIDAITSAFRKIRHYYEGS